MTLRHTPAIDSLKRSKAGAKCDVAFVLAGGAGRARTWPPSTSSYGAFQRRTALRRVRRRVKPAETARLVSWGGAACTCGARCARARGWSCRGFRALNRDRDRAVGAQSAPSPARVRLARPGAPRYAREGPEVGRTGVTVVA